MKHRLEKNGEGCRIGDKRILPREGEGGAVGSGGSSPFSNTN